MNQEDNAVWSLYASDAVQALQDVERCLLALEEQPNSAEEVNGLYRALHTLKGNSALLELTRIETLAHAAEDVVAVVRDGRARMEPATTDLLLRAVDTLRVVTQESSRTHLDVDDAKVAQSVNEVRAWLLERGETPRERALIDGSVDGVCFFSDQPRRGASKQPRSLAPDPDSVDMYLSLAQRMCFPGGKPVASADDLHALVDVLLPGAERLGFLALSQALSQLPQSIRSGGVDTASAVARLFAALSELETSSATLSGRPARRNFAGTLPPELLAPSSSPKPKPPDAVRPPQNEGGMRPDAPPTPSSQVLRIDAHKVSFVMDLAGEIGLACSAVTHHPDLAGQELEGFALAAHKLEMLVRELQNEVSALRLVPIATVFQAMKRVVRDTARRTGKQAELVLVGEDTEIDKVMVDALHDPLVHLLRNAIDHGIEGPAERRAAGKPESGRIVLEASHQGGEVLVRVSDDGRGLDRVRILKRAKERGLIGASAELSESQAYELLFLPGFSTKEQVDELSGRGVGMDVIKTTIEALRGRVRLSSSEGKGSTVALTVPLTMAFLDAMVVRDQGLLYAVPIERVCEVFKADRRQLCESAADGRTMLRVRDELVPVLQLGDYYGHAGARLRPTAGAIVIVVQTSNGRLALPVDTLLGNQPVMLKPLRGVIANIRAAAGCGMLRSGEVALTLDCEQLHG